MNENLLTIDDICHELGIGKSTAYKLLKEKKIKSSKIGSRLVVRKSELERYIKQQTEQSLLPQSNTLGLKGCKKRL